MNETHNESGTRTTKTDLNGVERETEVRPALAFINTKYTFPSCTPPPIVKDDLHATALNSLHSATLAIQLDRVPTPKAAFLEPVCKQLSALVSVLSGNPKRSRNSFMVCAPSRVSWWDCRTLRAAHSHTLSATQHKRSPRQRNQVARHNPSRSNPKATFVSS